MSNRNEPLAFRMSPRTLDEYVGQKHIIGEGKLLRRMIEADRLSSIILFGPPGTGKTALARLIALRTASEFVKLNAVTAGVADIKKVITDTHNPIFNAKGRTVLFIDEIHRFNKLQQDALLPHVEDGTIILIGATTENPFFEVNKAVISRSTVLKLEPLENDDIIAILEAAISDVDRGLGDLQISFDSDAIRFIADMSNGDARIALNALELASVTTQPDASGRIHIDLSVASECMQKRSIAFDSGGESHYDNISAFIKSMRGSDPDATVFYLARALHAGEDIEFLARRILICASEDVGLANPNAILVAMAAYQGVMAVGMPEARILLSEAAIMVATSPKSNSSYLAIDSALEDVQNHNSGPVPMHIRNAPAKGMKDLGYGVGYKYPHDFPGHHVHQQYLPDARRDVTFYSPTDNGYESKIQDWLNKFSKDS
jgi:putative ATPase